MCYDTEVARGDLEVLPAFPYHIPKSSKEFPAKRREDETFVEGKTFQEYSIAASIVSLWSCCIRKTQSLGVSDDAHLKRMGYRVLQARNGNC